MAAGAHEDDGGDSVLVGSVLEALGVTDGHTFDALVTALSSDGGRFAQGGGGSASKLVSADEALRRLKVGGACSGDAWLSDALGYLAGLLARSPPPCLQALWDAEQIDGLPN